MSTHAPAPAQRTPVGNERRFAAAIAIGTITRGVLAAAGAFVALGHVTASAQTPAAAGNYPSRPIRFIVPFPPGGGNDITARTLAAKLTEAFGPQVVVDNRPGAGGVIGAELAARAVPDGHTLFLGGVGSHAVNPNLHRRLPYDPLRDFAPVSLAASAPLVLVVHPSVPASQVKDLIALARARPGRLNFASNGAGGSSHLAAELFKLSAGVDLAHVPYKGFAGAATDLLSGQVQLMFSSMVPMVPQVRAGKVRALAVTSARRSPALPEVPSIAEAGLPGAETGSWYGVLVPSATPVAIVLRLNREIVRIVKLPEVNDRLAAEGAEPIGSTPEAFAAHIRSELARWRKVIDAAGLKPEA